jgi:photosystem II stability/assembly factor-like uncharacterized protein
MVNTMKNNINLLFILFIVFLGGSFLITIVDKDDDSNQLCKRASVEEEATDALESFQFISEIRAYPDRDIPPDKFFRAFEYSKSSIPEYNRGDAPTQWTSLGPNNIGGRSLCLTFSPTDTGTIYMGSASGGFWKSTTGGIGANAWSLVNTGYPSLAVSSIAIDSVNPNVMYVGTGENYGYQFSSNGLNVRVTRGMYGIGILKSTDGGNTWSKSLDWSYNNQRGVWSVVINPKNHNTLYSATSEGVYKSNNAGASWSQVISYQMVMDLKLNPVDTTILFISVGDLSNNVPNSNVGIYKSSDAGASWVKLSDGTHGLPTFWSGKTTLALYQGNPNYVYASVANDPSNTSNSYLGLYVSTDAGNTWTQKYNDPGFQTNQGWYNNCITVKLDDPNTIMLGALDVYKSTNGGTSFTAMTYWGYWNTGATLPGQPESSASNYSHADQHYFISNPKDPNKFYSITDGGLYRSNDFGSTFYSCNGGYVTTQFFATFANSYQDSIFCIGGMQDNRAAFYQGTVAWYKTFEGDGMCCAVNSQNSNICYTEYSWGQLAKSNNGGTSFGSFIGPPGSGNENSFCFATPYICCKSNPNIMYEGGTSIYKSSIGGGSWTTQNANLNGGKVLSMDCSSTSTDTVYAGVIPGSGVTDIFRTTDGQNWTNVSNGGVPNRYPTDIHVNPNNSREVYATFGGFGSGHVFKSTNAGVNWTDISGNLPDLPHHCVVIDPQYPQNIYVGNDLGVYVSTNNGVNWFSYSVGMPYALVFDLTIVYPNRHIRATTHGNGVFERSLVSNPLLGIVNNGQLPKEFKLFQNYPNPFNPSAKIKFDIAKTGNVTLSVFDITGRLVTSLVNERLQPGSYEVKFDGTGYSSGIYFYRLSTENFTDTKKMMLVK